MKCPSSTELSELIHKWPMVAENMAMRHIQTKHPKATFRMADARSLEFDFTLLKEAEETRIEVKFDSDSYTWQNLFFEVRNSRQNKDSGLRATKADLYYHIGWHNGRLSLFVYPPHQMLAAIESGSLKTCKAKLSVGNNNSDGFAVEINEVLGLPFVAKEDRFDFL